MRKFLWLLLFPVAAIGQVSNPSIILVSGAPSGACSNGLPDEQTLIGGTLYSCQSGTWGQVGGGGGSGTVTTVSVTTANGVSGTVTNPTTTPAITLTLGAITPTSTNGVSAATMAFMDATSSVQTQLNGKQATLTNPVTGPGSGATVGHLAVMGNTSGTSITDGGAVPATGAVTNITGSVTATGCTVSGGVCTVSGSTTSVVTFSVIPGTFNHLKLVFMGVGDSTWQSVPLTVNGDTGSHYADEGYFVTGTGAITGLSAVSQTSCKGLYLAASGAVTGSAEFDFPFYAQTSFGKTIVQEMMSYPSVSSATNNGALHSTCLWNQTSAITSITSTVGSGHFAAGSMFTLYGIN